MRRVLFLQLPGLDNAVRAPHENVPLAAVYLERALGQTPEGRRWRCLHLSGDELAGGNRELLAAIESAKPDAVACTLYLWNIERTLRVLRLARRRMPGVRIVVGGPETAVDHPFLFRAGVADAVVVGEGEAVLAGVLRWFRGGKTPNCTSVAVREKRGYRWGRHAAPPVRLASAVPPAGLQARRSTDRLIAYLETTRGCPMACAYCRYHHLRRDVECLGPDDVARRVAAFARAGFREVRFVDPTLNANPAFDAILRGLCRVNKRRRLRFFGEILGDAITAAQAAALARAGFRELEIGIQSTDPAVLRRIRRPTDLVRLERGIGRLAGRGIRLTLDVMYGLPGQTVSDVRRSIGWARRFRGVRVQCLQTLLLPGTQLRREARELGLMAEDRPPYGVQSTRDIDRRQMAAIERLLERSPDLPAGVRTACFVGGRLRDLFTDRTTVRLARLPDTPPGASDRRTVIVRGSGFFEGRRALAGFVRLCARREPDVLWQFVLECAVEEPLELFEELLAALAAEGEHVLDRYACARLLGRRAARRLFVRVPARHACRASWQRAVELLLASSQT